MARETIYCAHHKERGAQMCIDLGDKRDVMLCDLCTAKVELDVIKDLLNDLSRVMAKEVFNKSNPILHTR